MKVTISSIQIDGIYNEPVMIDVPKDLDSVREWLDDYSMKYTDDDDVRKVYIRTRLFQTNDILFDIDDVEYETPIDINKVQRYAIDIFDQNYKAYDSVSVNVNWPETFECMIDNDDFRTDGGIRLSVYSYLCHYLPVNITIE